MQFEQISSFDGARDRDGNVKWVEEGTNLVVNQGLDHLLDVTLSNATQLSTWYIGLINGASPTLAAGDTAASHAGWVEVTAYSEGVRQTWTGGTESGQSIDNSASPATFSINGTTTVGGAFLISANTKGGATGTLYAVGAFTGGDRALSNSDSLEVTATFTAGGS